jgi:hypothetical protein
VSDVLKHKELLLLVFILVGSRLCLGEVFAQPSKPIRVVGGNSNIEPRSIIDFPTAGVLPRKSFSSGIEFFQDGGLLFSLSFGIMSRVNAGISYGGSNVLGSEKISMNKAPGVQIKIRVLDESVRFFAIAIGFDSQGKESYVDSTKRYTIKSPGLFVVASKNYSFLGFLSVHGGLNYSLEQDDGDSDPNAYFGVEKTLGPTMTLLAEYNLGTNDDHPRAIGQGRGYLSVGWRWAVADGVSLGFDLKNLGKNRPQRALGNRVLKLEYVHFL